MPETPWKTRAVVLAGVHPWDDEGLDAILPRPLLPILNRALIGFVLDWLHGAGLERVTICTNRRTRLLRRLVSDGRALGLNVDYYEDWMPRGPAGCVRDAVADELPETLVIVDGTVLPRIPLDQVLRFHFEHQAAATVVTREVEAHDGEPGGFVPTGIYIVSREVLDHVPDVGYQDIKEMLIPRLRRQGLPVVGLATGGSCHRVTERVSYLAANAESLLDPDRHWLRRHGYQQAGEAWVHATARLSDGVTLVGPVLVGPGAQVARGAMLVGPCVLGAGVRLRDRCVVCRSVVWDDATIGRGSLVDRCVVTRAAELADRQEVFNTVWSHPIRAGRSARMQAARPVSAA